LKSQISSLDDSDKEYWQTLNDELIQTLDYIDSGMIIIHTKGGFQLIFNVEEFEKFDSNIGFLRMDLCSFQEGYHCKGQYEKEKALEAAQDVIDIFVLLLGNKQISDS
jgi:hypothetical protein